MDRELQTERGSSTIRFNFDALSTNTNMEVYVQIIGNLVSKTRYRLIKRMIYPRLDNV